MLFFIQGHKITVMLIHVQSSSANVKASMERDLATVLDIKRRHLLASP